MCELLWRIYKSCFLPNSLGALSPTFFSSLEVFGCLLPSGRTTEGLTATFFLTSLSKITDVLTQLEVAYSNSSHASQPLNSRTAARCWKYVSNSREGHLVCGMKPSFPASAGFVVLPNFFNGPTLQNYFHLCSCLRRSQLGKLRVALLQNT